LVFQGSEKFSLGRFLVLDTGCYQTTQTKSNV
jgi:hypothetical protein